MADPNDNAKAEYLKAAAELEQVIAALEKSKVGVNALDKKVEDLEKALE
jgi:hypothetical protein